MNPAPPSFSEKQRWSIALHVAVSTLAVLALALMANYLAARHFVRAHWRGDNPNQLTPQTLTLLRGLTNEVRATIFYDRDSALEFFGTVSSLLSEYRLACPLLRVEQIDYNRNPTAASLAKQRWKTAIPDENLKNTVVFDCNGRTKAVTERELYSLDIESVLAGRSKEIKRSAFQGELKFSEAINSVTDSKQLQALFLQGHREPRPDDDRPNGYGKFSALVELQNIRLAPLVLAPGSGDIPAECNLLIVAAPYDTLEPYELERIDRFLSRGGRLLALFSFEQAREQRPTGLEPLLAKWGVRVANDVVWQLDPSGTKPIDQAHEFILNSFPSPSHPIVRPLLRSSSRLRFMLPRTVQKLASGRTDADSPRVDPLVATDTNTLVVTRFANLQPLPSVADDRRGAAPVAAAVEKGSVQGLGADRGSTRLVVVGDSFCFANGLIDELANRDLAVQALNWLVDNPRLMEIGPRPITEYRVVMTPGQLSAVRWLLLVVFPGAVLGLGILVWFRRRT